MELRHLRYFVAVAEECHFGRAAARLHIAQPPLSQQIKQLEDDLGVTLLTRSTRRVELTPAGQVYLERARTLLDAVAAAGVEAGRVAAGEIGRLAIGFTGSATYELLPTLTRVLRADFPGIELDLKGEMLTPDQVGALQDRDLDHRLPPPAGARPCPRRAPAASRAADRRPARDAPARHERHRAPGQAPRRAVHHLPVAQSVRRVRRGAGGLPALRVQPGEGAGGRRDVDARRVRRGRARRRARAGLGAAPEDHRCHVPPAGRHHPGGRAGGGYARGRLVPPRDQGARARRVADRRRPARLLQPARRAPARLRAVTRAISRASQSTPFVYFSLNKVGATLVAPGKPAIEPTGQRGGRHGCRHTETGRPSTTSGQRPMTPFMLAVQALLDGADVPQPETEPSVPRTLAVATDRQGVIRWRARQLVCEPNAMLRDQGSVIDLVDDSGPGELAFTLSYDGRDARVQT